MSRTKEEYTPPTSARARKQHEDLNAQTQAFLNGGGVINEVPDYESAQYKPAIIDQASNKTRQDLAAARKRGKKKMKSKVAV